MTMNPVGWFEIYVNDIERARKFYETLFQVTLETLGDPSDENATLLSFPSNMSQYGISGALVQMEGRGAGMGGTIVYFSCDDCAVEAARVEQAGGQLVQEKFSIGEFGFCAMAVDSEGNMIGLHSLK